MRVSFGASSWKLTTPRVVPLDPSDVHAVVGHLFLDSRLECAGRQTDLDLPVAGRLIAHRDVLHTLGEAAELLVLCPEVVRVTQRHSHIENLDDVHGLAAGLALPFSSAEGILGFVDDIVLDTLGLLRDERLYRRLALEHP